jgi:hypothetical protein
MRMENIKLQEAEKLTALAKTHVATAIEDISTRESTEEKYRAVKAEHDTKRSIIEKEYKRKLETLNRELSKALADLKVEYNLTMYDDALQLLQTSQYKLTSQSYWFSSNKGHIYRDAVNAELADRTPALKRKVLAYLYL